MEKEKRKRLHLLDEIRGFLILGVVVSHTLFDMHNIFEMDLPWTQSWYVKAISDIGALLFILISSMVSKYSKDNISRGMKLLAVATALTLVTNLIMPTMVIYAGILHHLAFAIILMELLRPLLKRIPAIPALFFLLLLALFTWDIYERKIGLLGFTFYEIPTNVLDGGLSYLLGLKIINIIQSSDYYPVLPWMPFFFMGFYLIDYIEKPKIKTFFEKKRFSFLGKVGKISLWIYLLHQPLIYGILTLITSFK